MFKKITSTLFIAMVMLSMLTVSAQDDTITMVTTLEELTAESAEFYGETVTLEGTLIEFVNTSSFVLGEDAAIDDDRILIINNSGDALPIELFRGEFIVVTGVVHGSLEVHVDEMMDDDPDEDMDDDEVDHIDMDGNVLNYYFTGNFPSDFDGFTVLEIVDVDDIQFVVEEDED